MKKIIFTLIIFIITFSACFAGGKEEAVPGRQMIVEIIAFENTSANPEFSLGRLQTALNKIKAGYIAGYSFSYTSEGLVRTTVEAAVSGGPLQNMVQDQIEIKSKKYIYASGDFDFLSPDYPKDSMVTDTIQISSAAQIVHLYGMLISRAIRENCTPGSKGIIYPAGDIVFNITKSKVTLESKFIIQEK